jgi:hypothetical protein
MFVFYSCTCGIAYTVAKNDEDLHLLSLRMQCPNNKCDGGGLEIQNEDHGVRGVHRSAKELFALCSGRGTPKERQCSPAALEDLLLGARITGIDLEASTADPNRSLINSMVIGTDFGQEESKSVMVYFAMSSRGATIYKVIDL